MVVVVVVVGELVDNFMKWCSRNQLLLNVNKTEKVMVKFEH